MIVYNAVTDYCADMRALTSDVDLCLFELLYTTCVLASRKSEYTQALPFPKSASSGGRSGPQLIPTRWFLGPYTETTSRSIQSFCVADACDPATDRHTERPRYMCSSRPHPVLCNVMRSKRYIASPSPGSPSYWHKAHYMTDTYDISCAF